MASHFRSKCVCVGGGSYKYLIFILLLFCFGATPGNAQGKASYLPYYFSIPYKFICILLYLFLGTLAVLGGPYGVDHEEYRLCVRQASCTSLSPYIL